MNTHIIPHIPEKGSYGNCMQLVTAWMLGLPFEEVPHFLLEGDIVKGEKEYIDFLNSKGYKAYTTVYKCSLQELLAVQAHYNPGVKYILIGTSGKYSNTDHKVGCIADSIVFDPSGSGLAAPSSSGHYWVEVFVLN